MPVLQPSPINIQTDDWKEARPHLMRALNYLIKDIYEWIANIQGVGEGSEEPTTSIEMYTHDHDGSNSSLLSDASVGRGKLKTSGGGATGSLNASAAVLIAGQDYCFAPNIYSDSVSVITTASTTSSADYIMRFALYNLDGANPHTYTAYWRYITASDKPFVYVVKDKRTGEVLHIWAADDPPPGYWGCRETPEKFVPPILMQGKPDIEEVVCWNVEKDLYKELRWNLFRGGHGTCKRVAEQFDFAKGKVTRKIRGGK